MQSITPMTSNPHSDCHRGGLANRKMSLLASVCAQYIYIYINQYTSRGSETCCCSEPSNAKGQLQGSTGDG